MDRLLRIEPKNVVIKFELGQRSSGFVQLKNVMHTMPVAFKVQPIQKKYSVKPSSGIISPLGSASLEITMQPQAELPDSYPQSNDRFLIHSVVVPGGKEHETVSMDWFTAKKKQVFADSGLRVMFIGSCILTRLVADGSMEDIREVLEKDEEMVNSYDDQGRSSLHIAIASRRPDLVQLLLEFKADVDIKNKMGQTALQAAAAAGEGLIVELLVANCANTWAKNSSGWQAVHFAATGGHMEALRVLINKGADVNAAVNDGRTPLHMTVDEGHSDCLKIVLMKGANVDARTSEGETALHIAAARGDGPMVKLLLQKGANKDIRNKNGKTPYDLAAESGNTSLFDLLRLGDGLRRAARHGDLRTLQRLLEQGASINGRDQNGWTALHRASFKGWLEIVKALIDKGADLDSRDDEGYTVLHCATESGHMDLVQLLLKKGADINARSNRGVTALQIATSLHYSGIVRLLEEGSAIKDNETIDQSINEKLTFDLSNETPVKKKHVQRRSHEIVRKPSFAVQYMPRATVA